MASTDPEKCRMRLERDRYQNKQQEDRSQQRVELLRPPLLHSSVSGSNPMELETAEFESKPKARKVRIIFPYFNVLQMRSFEFSSFSSLADVFQ